jgi:UDP-N-acetylglucosamine/UDP-N-acetylgalactosamine diphosphorylase
MAELRLNTELSDDLKNRYAAFGQDHVFKYYDTLGDEEKVAFVSQLERIPVEKLDSFVHGGKSILSNGESEISPFEGSVASINHPNSQIQQQTWNKLGLEAISQNKVAALVLAGGQGTRLGFDGPKGCYDIEMPSGKTLFQLIAERIRRLQQLACNHHSASNETVGAEPELPLYVMTSPLNHLETVEYFQRNNNFGIQVHFFPQGMLPCLDMNGKIILEGPGLVAMAPDGNGGIYPALEREGMLDRMKETGIQHVHVFSIDNALCRPADPCFVGYCIAMGADVGNKVVWKTEAREQVGVMASKNGKKPCVVEYSDITTEMAERTDQDGKLVFGAANICNHYYTLEFLATTVMENMQNMYHIAYKKIPYFNGSDLVKPDAPNGMKLESFIFDVFELSQTMAVLEVKRQHEFAPVKNAKGKDSPETARQYLSEVAKEYMEKAGAMMHGKEGEGGLCEVSPLTSYAGEGLEEYHGRRVLCPFSI